MKFIAFLFFSATILTSCNSGAKDGKEEAVKTDSLTQVVNDVTPAIDPSINANAPIPQPKCFENDGLKYRITINLNYISAVEFSGMITTDEYGKKLVDKQRFIGSVKGNDITVKFMNRKLPVVGDATEWTTKPWTIKNTLGAETLSIIFNAKNYDTNQWAETSYEFKGCTTKSNK